MKSPFNRNNFLSIAVIIITSLWVLFTTLSSNEVSGEIYSAPQKGFTAPDFILQDLEGNQYSIIIIYWEKCYRQYLGKLV